MKRISTSAIAVFVGILVVTGVIVAAVGLGTDGATAIKVGDQTESKADLNRELSDWADFKPANAKATEGSVTSTAGTTIATQIVYQLLAEQYLDQKGEQVTAADRASARQTVAGASAGAKAFREAPAWFQQRFLRRQAVFAALTRLVGSDDQGTSEVRLLRRLGRHTDVSVNAAYGRYAPLTVRVRQYPTPFTPGKG